MDIREEHRNGVCRLHPVGDMSIFEAAALKPALLDLLAHNEALEIDLSEVTEFDTAGAQLLMLLKREAAATGKTVHLADHSPAVLGVIESLRLAAWFGDPVVLTGSDSEAKRHP